MGSYGPKRCTCTTKGQDARLPDWLKEQQREATDAARPADAIQDGVERYIETAPETFTLEAVAYHLKLIDGPYDGANVSQADQQRIGAALRHYGYQKARRRVNRQAAQRLCQIALLFTPWPTVHPFIPGGVNTLLALIRI